jgi:hypothetical protein
MLGLIRRLAPLSLLWISLFAPLARPQASPPANKKDTFDVARDILAASYPEIFGKNWYIGFSTGQLVDNNSWGQIYGFDFKVTRFGPGVSWNTTSDTTGKIIAPPENSTFLQGSSWIDYRGQLRILRFVLDGDLACSRQNKALRDLVETHPEWSEEEAIRAMKQAGARYGPRDQEDFLKAIRLDRFEGLLGRLQTRLVAFQGLSPDHLGNFASLFWVVQAESILPDGTHRKYGFRFEPFEGKLIGLSQIQEAK